MKKKHWILRVVCLNIAYLIVIIGCVAWSLQDPKENNQDDPQEEQYTVASLKASSLIESPNTELPETQPPQNPENQRTVYYTKTGECYHNENPCGRGTYRPVALDKALQMGLRPCEKCVLH